MIKLETSSNIISSFKEGMENSNGFRLFDEIEFEGVPLFISPSIPNQWKMGFSREVLKLLLKKEYKSITSKLPFVCELSEKERRIKYPSSSKIQNINKNRYNDILCTEETRFVFKKDISENLRQEGLSSNSETSDLYINANYISFQSFQHINSNNTNEYNNYPHNEGNIMNDINSNFIATQAPLENTMFEFFKMIWDSNSSLIISLSSLIENGKVKMAQFWPNKTGEEISFKKEKEEFSIILLNLFFENLEQKEGGEEQGIVIRKLLIFNKTKNLKKEITQIHFTHWPDGNVISPQTILNLYLLQKKYESKENKKDSPIVVHCSAGIGRTASYIAFVFAAQIIDYLREKEIPLLRNSLNHLLNIPNIVKSIRSQRCNSLQNQAQYEFIYSSINFYLWNINQKQSQPN